MRVLPAGVLAALNVSLTLVMPINHEPDSVDQVQRLADQLRNCSKTDYRSDA